MMKLFFSRLILILNVIILQSPWNSLIAQAQDLEDMYYDYTTTLVPPTTTVDYDYYDEDTTFETTTTTNSYTAADITTQEYDEMEDGDTNKTEILISIGDNLYPCGEEQNDIRVENGLDKASDPIPVPRGGIFFANRKCRNLFISSNGLISCNRPYIFWWANKFPLRERYGRAIVASFWGDHDTRGSSAPSGVYYHTYDMVDDENTSGQTLLERVSADVSQFTNGVFEATWMIVVTWIHVYPYPYWYYDSNYIDYYYNYNGGFGSGSSPKQTITHQTVLVTYGMKTYTLFNYGDMNWKPWKNANMGYDAGDGVNFFNHYLARQSDILNIGRLKGNTGLNGKWIFRLDTNGDNKPNFDQKCVVWAAKDKRTFPLDTPVNATNLEPCPCSFRAAAWDRRFRIDWYFACAYQRFATVDGFGQLCCYSDDWWVTWWSSGGPLLTDINSGAGHFLRYHDRTSVQHVEGDVMGRYYCCEASDNCDIFMRRRPVDTCEGYIPPRRTWFWGDPHVRTLDGKQYTFNGLGEYWLIRTTDFNLHGRTSAALTANGTATR
ncbi:unnamed protein product, partial [Owenia fusiformis]